MAALDGWGPLYAQVAEQLRESLTAHELAGRRLPSERELAQQFHVSRATIRRALADLVDVGLVERTSGTGFRVADRPRNGTPPVGEETEALMSFSELAASRGLVASATVVSFDVEPADLDLADLLAIAPGSDVFVLQRLRRLDGVPVAIDHNRVPLAAVPDAAARDWTTESLYEALDQHGHSPTHADYTAEAIAADAIQAELLQVPIGSPLLATTTLSREDGGRPVESGRLVCRGDRYRFRATLRRRPSSGRSAEPTTISGAI